MPLSLLDMIHNYWPLGSGQVCKEGFVKTCRDLIFFRKFCVNWAPPPNRPVSSSALTQLPSSQLTGKLTKVTTIGKNGLAIKSLASCSWRIVFVTFLKHERVFIEIMCCDQMFTNVH